MGLFSSSKSSTSNQSNTTNTYDQRQVNDASGGGTLIGSGAHVTSTTTISTVDPGLKAIAGQAAALVQSIDHQQGDTMKVIAGLGTAGIKAMGDSATKLFSQAESNSATAWGHTIDASEATLDKMFGAASGILQTSTGLAQAAMSAYEPSDNKASDNTVKVVAYVAAAAVVAFLLTRKG
jgi:hypothetical protein